MSNLILRASDDVPGERWALDLDVAAIAGMAVPLNIRRTIAPMVEEKILNDYNVWRMRQTSGETPGPMYDLRVSAVPVGTMGGTKNVGEYYLNDAAVLRVLNRLRTPEAEEASARFVVAMQERMVTMLAAAREEGRALGTQATRLLLADPTAEQRRALREQHELDSANQRLSVKMFRRFEYDEGDPSVCPCSATLTISRSKVGNEVVVTATCENGHEARVAELTPSMMDPSALAKKRARE